MSERELLLWSQYAVDKGFPNRRSEIGLALVSLTIARAMGGNTELTIDDFLLDKKELKKVTTEEHAMNISALAGGIRVRKLGQGRKKK